ncbi:LutC/YkgG family protein [Vagococcus carniphilus]|uniref:LutC/YkgG family protein n=1 Tax=Vagococcus carniphilus TaxID=218144 RepID=UPI0035D6A485
MKKMTDNQNREKFLKNLYNKLETEPSECQSHPYVPINNLSNETFADKTKDELLEICYEKVKELNIEMTEVTENDLEEKLKDIIISFGSGPMILPTDKRFDSIRPFLEKEYKEQISYWKEGAEYRESNINAAEQANIGIAFSEYLLAESGSIVVETSSGQGRTLHFLPTHYISIIPKSQIVPRSTQAINDYAKRIERGEKLGSAIHIISGPSNSGDIEMQLVIGLHGPLKVHYLVISDK